MAERTHELPEAFRAEKDLACVVLCAGKGTRLLPLSNVFAKTMIPIDHRPMLDHVIDSWSRYVDRFVFVVGYRKEQVIAHVSDLGIPAAFVVQPEQTGIAAALGLARRFVGERFISVLGDCLCRGTFRFPEGMTRGVGVVRTDDADAIRQSYAVQVDGTRITGLEEKPGDPPNDLCGMGFYFLDRAVFTFIDRTSPSSLRGEVEITDALDLLAREGPGLDAAFFEGDYLNINTTADVDAATALFK